MKKIFLVYGHYNEKSFNAAIRDTFIATAKSKGHQVDFVDLYKEKFNPVFAGEKPDEVVIDHQNRIDGTPTFFETTSTHTLDVNIPSGSNPIIKKCNKCSEFEYI